ncbi:energy-coupling factor transporter transmembrane component T family protein [Fructilactobacillus sanfranciscensis]|uniref:energy-coupling factor transporter transmembrane component T family protein n=1 Tax=Fructilactobacillus sanfranciscensis TaxID=1625 RepID=UPI00375847CD
MNNFIFGQYIPGKSLIYRLNPRLKLIASVLLIIASFINHNLLGFIILLGICGVIIQVSQVGWIFFIKGTQFFIYMIFLTSILQILFSNGGTIYWHYGIFTISSFGLQIASLAFLRFLVAIVILTVYLMTTNPAKIAQTIQGICYPLKFVGVNLDDIGLVTAIALRFVPTLTEEVNNLRNAQKSRGINFEKCSIIKRIKSNIAILVPLFMSVFRRAEQLAATMILRGYTDGNKHRTHIRQSNWSKFDSLILIVVLLVFGLILSLNINF